MPTRFYASHHRFASDTREFLIAPLDMAKLGDVTSIGNKKYVILELCKHKNVAL